MNEINAKACLNAKVVKFIKIVPCVKIKEHVVDISLDMCSTMHPSFWWWLELIFYSIFVMFVGIFSHHALAVCHWWVESMLFVNVMSSNHTVELSNTSTSTFHSNLASTIQVNNKLLALNNWWTYLNAGSNIIYSK